MEGEKDAERDRNSNADLNTALGFANQFRGLLRRAISAEWPAAPFASPEGVLKVATSFLTSAVHGAFEAIILLCREGWGVESDVLLRQLQEAVVNARAIERNRSVLFLYTEEIEKHAVTASSSPPLPKMPDAMLPTRILGTPPKDDTVAWYQDGKSKGKRRHWKDLTMETRVRLADLDTSIWYGVYRNLCSVVHAGPGAMIAYLHEDYWGTVRYGPDRNRAFRSCVSACGLMIVHLGMLDGVFSLGIWRETETVANTMWQFLNDRDSGSNAH